MATVLLVEDNDDVREMMSLALELAGNRVIAADNGREALRVLREQPLPSIILLDLMMPVMNGWQLRATLKQDPRLASIPIVVVSALNEEMAGQMGPRDYLPKPVDIDRMLQLVGELCQ